MDTSCLWDVLDSETTLSLDDTRLINDCQSHSSLCQLTTCIRVTHRTGSGHDQVMPRSGLGEVVLCSWLDVVAMALECQLMLYSITRRQMLSTLVFDSALDCVAFNADGSLLIVGERSGAVHAINAKTGEQLMSQRLGTNSGVNTAYFKTAEFGANGQLAVLTSDGRVHVIDGWLAGQLRHNVLDCSQSTCCLTQLSSGGIITIDTDDTLTLWSVEDDSFSLASTCPMLFGPALKCATLPCDHYSLVLDSSGRLVLWNVYRFVAISVLSCPAVADFVVVDHPPDSPRCVGTVAVVHNSDTSNCISIYSMPCSELIYSVNIHQGALLFPSSVVSESIYLLENDGSNWQVRSLAETDPQTRLKRLLAKYRFTEAESFAEKFGLDVQLVYRECVSYVMTKLSVRDESVDELASQLISCLSRLDDVAFVVDCCVTVAMPTLALTNQLLSIAQQRIDSVKQLSAEQYAALSSRLEQTTRRLAAFQVVFGAEEYSVDRWQQFHTVDLYDELCQWLRQGRLDVASTLCGQFADLLSTRLVSRLDDTLALVSDAVAVNDLCAWLIQDVVPPVLASQDTVLIDRLASWVVKKATDMEVMSGWPENAICLCDVLWIDVCALAPKNLTIKEHACRTVWLAVPQTDAYEARTSQNSLVRLHALHNDLRQIMELRDKYNCLLSLDKFRTETVQTLAYRFLDRVAAAELISSAISDVVTPYMIQNCLNLDDLLVSYVEELVHRRGSGGMHVSAVWESKAVEILHHISTREMCERTLMAILGAAQFPWSEDVSNAVKSALDRNPGHEGLQTQRRWASLRDILIHYDLHTFNFADTAHAEDLAYYILTQDRVTAVADALAVTDIYSNVSSVDVYLFRCVYLAEHDRPNDIVCLLRGIALQTLRDDVCERFVCYCGKVLSDSLSSCRHKFAVAARHLCQLLSDLSPHCTQALRTQLSDLNAVQTLDKKFGKFVTVSDFGTTWKREELCDQWLDDFFEEALKSGSVKLVGESSTMMSATGAAEVDRDGLSGPFRQTVVTAAAECAKKRPRKGDVCQMTRLMKMSARAELYDAVSAARCGDIGTAVKLTEHLVRRRSKIDTETVQNVLRIFVAVCKLIEAGSDVSLSQLMVLHNVSCRLVLTCPSVMLDQSLRVSRFIRLALEVASQCDDTPLSQLSAHTDPYTQWTFDEFLSDDDCSGLVMDMKSALPLVFSVVAAAVALSVSPGILFHPSSNTLAVVESVGKVTQMLTAHNQTRLFLAYSLELASLVGTTEKLNAAILSTLKQCISRRRADHQLALTAVLSLPHSLAHDNLWKLAKSAGIQYKKSLAIAHVGEAFAQLSRDSNGLSVARSFLVETRWGYQLAKVKVSFHGCFRKGSEDKRSLIPTLAATESVSVDDVVEYCADFKLNVNDSLCFYLTCLLLPAPDSTSVVPSIPFSVVQQRAEEACRRISWKAAVETLKEIFAKTSSYDYERLEFIVNQIILLGGSGLDESRHSTEPSERDRKLLGCLKLYRRVSPPSEDEIVSAGDDEAVRTRLPFHALRVRDHDWRIITAELNADTVHQWIAMSRLLQLPTDSVYTTAVRNIVRCHVVQLSSHTAQWSEHSVDTTFMDTVHSLLSQVSNTELSVAALSWIARELPPGAEKVVAYGWCVSMQEKHLTALCSQGAERAQVTASLDKHRHHYRQAAIEQVLHTSGLAEPSLLALTSGPARLIFRLYEHPSITERVCHYRYLASAPVSADSHTSTMLCGLPDIHAAVNRIAEIGSVNTSKVRRTLLDQWLASTTTIHQQETTDVTMIADDSLMTDSSAPATNDTHETASESVDLLRAVYLLQHDAVSTNDALMYLMTCFDDSEQASSVT